MGLFDRTNTRATAGSLTRWALLGALLGPLLIGISLGNRSAVFRRSQAVILLAASLVGAGACALARWQLDDDSDEETNEQGGRARP